MKKQHSLFRYFLLILLVAGMTILFSVYSNTTSNASVGTFELKLDQNSIKNNQTFTVTLTLDSTQNLQSAKAAFSYDASLIEWLDSDSDAFTGSNGQLTFSDTFLKATKKKTYHLTFQALQTGNGRLDMKDCVLSAYEDLTPVSTQGCFVDYEVVPNALENSDTTLKELLIGSGELSPEWDKNTYDYSVTVPKDTTIFTYSATPSSKDATVVSDGPETLSDGNNTYVITVTAPSGDSEQYTITVTR